MGDFSRTVDLRRLLFCTALVLLVAACSGAGQKKILGAPAIGTPPTVIATLPAASTPIADGIATTSNALPRSVILINGAQAKNVYWQVGSAATINVGSVMVGTMIAKAGVNTTIVAP